ncbi:MAG TPA: DUF4350 domain-containing protein [Smithella sp.]|nr:DUF4350 domain-containing protein [Smithella sp.]
MRINYKTKIILLLIIFTAFIIGTMQLFVLSFEAGDVYPAYSSLRTDPLGAKALYESFGALSGLNVQRNYGQEDKITDANKSTFFYFGVDEHLLSSMPENDVKKLERIVSNGGRIVITLMPQTFSSPVTDKKETTEKKEPDKKEKSDERPCFISLAQRWQFSLAEDKEGSAKSMAVLSSGAAELLPPNISWHAITYFENTGSDWISQYTVSGHPVMMERRFGRGSIVLATDSYFISNEAMLKERYPTLLTWLAGPHNKIIFDETHLGVNENPGIASLFGKYHLRGLLISIIILGILFIWKNSSSLVPAKDDENDRPSNIDSSKDYISGFVNMLRRSIFRESLLRVCLAEWEKTANFSRKNTAPRRERIENLILAQKEHFIKENTIIKIYNEAIKILTERNYK